MSALEQVGQALDAAASSASQAQTALVSAGERWNERGQLLAECLFGSSDLEAQELLAGHEPVADDMRQTWRTIAQVIEAIEQYKFSLGLAGSPGGPTQPQGVESADRPAQPRHATARDGSQYPAEAQWAIDEGMPPRVQRDTGTRTIGYVQVNDVPMRVQSGDDGFSDMVDERLRELGFRRRVDLRRHVEMKVAAMLLRSGQRHQEVVINHAPCGSEPGTTKGCHALLPTFLREGYSLTVHGTDANGEPFTQTYRGSA